MNNNEAIEILNDLKKLHCVDRYAIDIMDVKAIDHAIKCMRNEERIKKCVIEILQYVTAKEVVKIFKDKPYRLRNTIEVIQNESNK